MISNSFNLVWDGMAFFYGFKQFYHLLDIC